MFHKVNLIKILFKIIQSKFPNNVLQNFSVCFIFLKIEFTHKFILTDAQIHSYSNTLTHSLTRIHNLIHIHSFSYLHSAGLTFKLTFTFVLIHRQLKHHFCCKHLHMKMWLCQSVK